MTEVKLSEIKCNGVPIHNWAFIDAISGLIRVYYEPNGEDNGFSFYAVEMDGKESNDDGTWAEDWDIHKTDVKTMYWGNGYFDGVRHLHMGSEVTEDCGYHFYPDLDANIAALRVIRELEVKYCRDK